MSCIETPTADHTYSTAHFGGRQLRSLPLYNLASFIRPHDLRWYGMSLDGEHISYWSCHRVYGRGLEIGAARLDTSQIAQTELSGRWGVADR